MSFPMERKFVGLGGRGSQKGSQKGSEVVFDNGEDGSQRTKRMLRPIRLDVLVVFVTIAALDSFYTLSENEMAVFTTFGRPSSAMTSGPKFRYPFIREVYKMSREIKGVPIGYSSDYNAEYPIDSESNPISLPSKFEMITKDLNFVDVGSYTEHQTVDLIKTYINNDAAISILENLAQSYIRDTVGSYGVDEVITMDRSEIQAKVKSLLSEHPEQKDIRIGIVGVAMQDAGPSTEVVNSIFKAAENAKQGTDTRINEAKKYQSKQPPVANAKTDKAAKDAEAYRQQHISEAEGQVPRFNDIYEEYAEYPLIIKKRMFYETMEELLPALKVIINGSGRTQTILPLDSLVSENQNGDAR